jgi:hypothetical protein
MWTSIYVANNKKQADKMKEALDDEGILTNIRSVGSNINDDGIFEIQVLESEVEEAQTIVCSYSGHR